MDDRQTLDLLSKAAWDDVQYFSNANKDQRERWVGSGLPVARKQFRRIQGYKQIPLLLTELEALAPGKSRLAKRRKAS